MSAANKNACKQSLPSSTEDSTFAFRFQTMHETWATLFVSTLYLAAKDEPILFKNLISFANDLPLIRSQDMCEYTLELYQSSERAVLIAQMSYILKLQLRSILSAGAEAESEEKISACNRLIVRSLCIAKAALDQNLEFDS